MPPEALTGDCDARMGVRHGLNWLVVAFALLTVSLAALVSLPQPSPAQARPIAVVFPPWVSGADAVARSFAAGHLVLRSGRFASIVVVASGTETADGPARPQGAVLMLSLVGLAGCLDSDSQLEPSK